MLLAGGSTSPQIRRHAVESLNAQLSLVIYALVGGVVAGILAIATVGLALILIVPLGLALVVVAIVLPILGAVRANAGEDYRYPLILRMVS